MTVLASEPRMCPHCSRMLGFYNGKYLCKNCWELFDYDQTTPHRNPSVVCNFNEKISEMGIYLICKSCSKVVFLSKEDIATFSGYYEPGYVAQRRSELEIWKRQTKLELQESQEKAKRSEAMRKVFEQVYGAGGLDKVRLVSGEAG